MGLSFQLLVVRLPDYEGVHSITTHIHSEGRKYRIEGEMALKVFLRTQFQEQAERNHKGKESIEQFNKHFMEFINGLVERGVASFDSGTTIFEPSGKYSAYNITKRLTEMWKQGIEELMSMAKSKFASKQQVQLGIKE